MGFELDEKIELVENNTVAACIMHKKGSPLKCKKIPTILISCKI